MGTLKNWRPWFKHTVGLTLPLQRSSWKSKFTAYLLPFVEGQKRNVYKDWSVAIFFVLFCFSRQGFSVALEPVLELAL